MAAGSVQRERQANTGSGHIEISLRQRPKPWIFQLARRSAAQPGRGAALPTASLNSCSVAPTIFAQFAQSHLADAGWGNYLI
jgi:hypothetical protein